MIKKFLLLLAIPMLAILFACNPQKKLARKTHTYMESAYTDLKKAVNEAEVTILNDTVKVLFPEHLLFQKNSAQINKETYPIMQRFANALNKYNKTSILINGYTDNTGGDDINKKLSQNRADSARSLLNTYTVESGRMFTWGLGSESPITNNNSEDGRRKNRRVEFIILYSYEPAK
jgi:outer membrane protein OmpA-like peptidoglycan-associated protein